jgi:tetratricopeptide (TPR) repeat protein
LPLAARLVEVLADWGQGYTPRYRCGSGCLVAGRTVLTAAHVVAGAVSVLVRGPDKVEHRAALDAEFIGDTDGPGPDLALIEIIDGAVDVPAMGLAVVDRDSPAGDPVERCQVIGYPAFRERDAADGGTFRETADAFGQVPVLSGLARGLLSVQVNSSPQPLPSAQVALGDSPWSGMSGGPVVADGYLLAVVTEHAPREGSSAITATPLTALERDPAHPGWGPGVADPSAWWARLGVSGAGALKRLPAPLGSSPSSMATYRRFYGERLTTGVERFVDRSDLRSKLRKLLLSGQCRIVSIIGHRGIGKSALVAKVLAEFESSNSKRKPANDLDAIVYLSMRTGTGLITLDLIYLAIAKLANDPERENLERLWNNQAKIDPFPSLFEAFSSRKLVVVLDNLDDLQDANGALQTPDVFRFLGAVCRTPYPFHVVTTSQRPLLLPAEVTGDIYVMDIENGLDPNDASRLLRTLDSDGSAGLRDADENDLRAAAERLYGTPRGLELLAGDLRGPMLGIQDVLGDGSTLEEILSQLISAGYANLNEVEASVVQLVAVAGVPLPRTALVSLLPQWPSGALGVALRELVVKRLLNYDKGTGQIRLHPLDADYVTENLLGQGSHLTKELHRRLAEWYVTQRSDAASRRTLADITAQRREFAHRIAMGDRLGALNTLADVAEFMARHGGIEALGAADTVANDNDPAPMRIDRDWCRGFAEYFGGSLTEALKAFSSARGLITEASTDDRGPALDYWIGATLRHMGRARPAVDVLKRAIDATPEVTSRVRALFELGLAYCYLQDQSNAGAVVIALEKLVDLDSPAIVRGQLHNLCALVKLVTPDYGGAITEVDDGLRFYRVTQQQDNEGFLWNLRGLAQLGADKEDGALADLTRGRDCAVEYGVLRLQGICWTNLAWALLRKGKLQEATDAATTGERLLKVQGTDEAGGAQLLRQTLESRPQSVDVCRDQLANAVAGTLGNPDFYQPTEQVLGGMAAAISSSHGMDAG